MGELERDRDRRRATERIRAAARRTGFDRCAVAPVRDLAAAPRLREWLRRGMHGDMHWLAHDPDRRSDPRRVVPGARSVLMLTREYWTGDPVCEDPRRARISRYAWGAEYHEVMEAGLRRLYRRIREIVPGAEGRYYVDHGPVMEKAWAELAGLGWIGKHTNLLTVGRGSWFFLGAILLDVELAYGRPGRDHCGSCTACIDVCPTGAIVAPYVLDSRLCISYLTIEHRGPIPRELRASFGNRVFGCDDCQDVCPWNRYARAVDGAAPFAPGEETRAPELRQLLSLDAEGFRERFRHSPVRRAGHDGFLRNVAVAAGNSGDRGLIPDLARVLADGPELARGHCAWALGRLGGPGARVALEEARHGPDPDPWVREEVELALETLAS